MPLNASAAGSAERGAALVMSLIQKVFDPTEVHSSTQRPAALCVKCAGNTADHNNRVRSSALSAEEKEKRTDGTIKMTL